MAVLAAGAHGPPACVLLYPSKHWAPVKVCALLLETSSWFWRSAYGATTHGGTPYGCCAQ